ncbi:MAG: DNA polymerase III subunit beta [Thermotogae bacterium]|nr:DNA polymerase III subunit beta [Thermotogota bacterium]
MRLVVDRDVLEEAVSITSKASSTKSADPILTGILMKYDGKLKLFATDLEIGLAHEMDVLEGEGSGGFVIDAKLINEIVKNLPENSVEMIYDSGILEIKSGKSRFRLNTIPPDDFPDFSPAEGGTSIELPCDTVKEMMEKVIFCAATDEFMKNLNGIFWEFEDGFFRLVAADGFRLGLVEERIDGFGESLSFLLSLKSMKDMVKVLSGCDGNFTLTFDGSKVSFAFDNTKMVVRIVDAEFPDYRRVIPSGFTTKLLVDRLALREALRRVSITAKFGSEGVKFDIKDEIMTIESRSQDYGEAYEELEIEKEGQDIVVAFNPKFLLDSLQKIESDSVELNLIDPSRPLQMNPPDVMGYLYIIMPLRL